ncbi:MAG: LysE family transporter [Omnitrophica WOR_2 bacterium]
MILTSSLLSVFVFSFVIGMGAVITPGPVSTAIVSQAPRRGWLVGPLLAAGHSVMELVLLVLIAVGLGAGLAQNGVQAVIAVAGGALLVWMGIGMGLNILQGKVHLPGMNGKLAPLTYGQIVGLGMVATVSNPFWYAWWVTVVPGYLARVRNFGLAAIAAFFLGHIFADFLWDTFLSSVIGKGRKWMTDRLYQGLILLCSGFFIYLGIQFVLQGFHL